MIHGRLCDDLPRIKKADFVFALCGPLAKLSEFNLKILKECKHGLLVERWIEQVQLSSH